MKDEQISQLLEIVCDELTSRNLHEEASKVKLMIERLDGMFR